MKKQEMWNKFNLAEKNPDPGAGILYCLKYDKDRIKSHQESVVNALKSMGIKLEDAGELIKAKLPRELDKSEIKRGYALFEELSCLNEALEYSEVGFNQFNNIYQLKTGLMALYVDLLKENKIGAYNLITMTIPQIVKDLRIANEQNKILSKSDKKDLTDLINFAEKQSDVLNKFNHDNIIFILK